MNDDSALLRHYAEARAEDAFAALVERHLPLVYHTALRQLAGDVHHARDAAQAVFCDLARKAPALARRPVVLAGWLHTATHHATARIRRAEHRRLVREEHAASMTATDSAEPSAAADWTRVSPVIDACLQALPTRDREAVLLRFFEGRSYAEIGARFAVSADGARHRVDRALEKLRRRLARHGIDSTGAALALALTAQAATPAPAGLAASITASATAAAIAAGAGGGAAVASWTLVTLAKLGLGTAALVVAFTVGRQVFAPAVGKTSIASPAATTVAATAPSPLLTAADVLGADFRARLADATADDFGRVLVELWRLGTPEARARFREVFDHWCGHDPAAASRWAVITRTTDIGGADAASLREQAALAWAALDLAAAYAWTLGQTDEPAYDGLASIVLRELAKTDPARALALAQEGSHELRVGTERLGMFREILETWARTDPEAALTALDGLAPEKGFDRVLVAGRITGIWAEREPVAATWRFLSIPAADDARTSWFLDFAHGNGRADPAAISRATVSWWEHRPSTQPPLRFPAWGLAEVVHAWARQAPDAAFSFVAREVPSSIQQLLVERIAGTMGLRRVDDELRLDCAPETALGFLGLLQDDYKRLSYTRSFVEAWAEVDPSAALAWSAGPEAARFRESAQDGAFRAIARADLPAALSAWQELSAETARAPLALALAEGWAESDPAAAVAWFTDQFPDATPFHRLQSLMARWMSRDPAAACRWVEAQDDLTLRETATAATQELLPPDGLAYTVRLAPDSESRVRWLRNRVDWWLQREPEVAAKFLRETPLLTDDEKAQLLPSP